MAILVSVVVTAMVMTIAWVATTSLQTTTSLTKADQSFYIAEAGAQKIVWFVRNNKMASITSPINNVSCGSGAYSVSWTISGQNVRITSVGAVGTAQSTCALTATLPAVSAAAAAPSFFINGDLTDKNVQITGNITVNGSITANHGNGSVSGTLTYTGTNSGAYSAGNLVHAATVTPPVDFDALAAQVSASPVYTYNSNQTNTTFNFNSYTGSNKVIVVNGNVTNPVFSGVGTLYVTGSVTFTGNASVGTATNPVNIVSLTDINFNKKATIFGSIFARNNLNTNQYDVTGILYTAGNYDGGNNGQSTIIYTPPVNFPGSGTGALQQTNFTGPGI